MELIKIEPTKHKPGVIFDPASHSIAFSGFSLPEDAMDFFLPLINWLYEYSCNCEEYIQKNITFQATFRLAYYNSASYRAFLEMFHILHKMHTKGLKININWYYEKNDTSMIEGGKELAEMAQLNVNFIEFV